MKRVDKCVLGAAVMALLLLPSVSAAKQGGQGPTVLRPGTADATLKADITKALQTPETFDGLSFRAKRFGKDWILTVEPKGIGWVSHPPDRTQRSEATLVMAWYDAQNKLLGNIANEEVFKRVPPGAGPTYTLPISKTTGAARLRFIVRDAVNGQMGTLDLTKF